jgi:hypothetical protein
MESSKKDNTESELGRPNSEAYAENEHPLPKNKTISPISLNFTNSFFFSSKSINLAHLFSFSSS